MWQWLFFYLLHITRACDIKVHRAGSHLITHHSCSLGSCEDKKAECGGWGDHCVGGDYENWMKDNCPKTCGYCDGGTGM